MTPSPNKTRSARLPAARVTPSPNRTRSARLPAARVTPSPNKTRSARLPAARVTPSPNKTRSRATGGCVLSALSVIEAARRIATPVLFGHAVTTTIRPATQSRSVRPECHRGRPADRRARSVRPRRHDPRSPAPDALRAGRSNEPRPARGCGTRPSPLTTDPLVPDPADAPGPTRDERRGCAGGRCSGRRPVDSRRAGVACPPDTR